MCKGLAEAIEEHSIPLDGDALAEAFALADRLQAKLVQAVGDYDRSELWNIGGATSMAAWLRDRAGLTDRRARYLTRLGRRLCSLPVTAAAWRAGELSGGQVEAIVAAVDDVTVEVFAAGEHELVPALAGLSMTETARVMATWKAYATADGTEPAEPDRALHLSPTLGGTGALDGTLSPEGYVTLKAALRMAESPDLEGDPARQPAQRRHDALVDIARFFLDHQQTRSGGRHRPHLNVIVDLEALAGGAGGHSTDGTALDAATTAKLLCDSALHRVVMTGRSSILDYGTATRTTPVNLWNALAVRDGGCRWPGCDRSPDWCQAHHIRWASRGGPTRPTNEVLLCNRHHHIAHQPGWRLRLDADATLTVTDPAARTRSTRPPGTLWPLVA
jgi:uncharacterized protein DUF222